MAVETSDVCCYFTFFGRHHCSTKARQCIHVIVAARMYEKQRDCSLDSRHGSSSKGILFFTQMNDYFQESILAQRDTLV